jgi:hypothetical protein
MCLQETKLDVIS